MSRNTSTRTFGAFRRKSAEKGEHRRKSGESGKREKTVCLTPLVPKTDHNELPEIQGIEQLDQVPPGSAPIAEGFYADEVALLVRRAKNVLTRDSIFIAPRIGWPKGIYRKP